MSYLCAANLPQIAYAVVSLPLAQADAEIIVTFEATTEFGNPFLSRQSYLPNEIHWCVALP